MPQSQFGVELRIIQKVSYRVRLRELRLYSV